MNSKTAWTVTIVIILVVAGLAWWYVSAPVSPASEANRMNAPENAAAPQPQVAAPVDTNSQASLESDLNSVQDPDQSDLNTLDTAIDTSL